MGIFSKDKQYLSFFEKPFFSFNKSDWSLFFDYYKNNPIVFRCVNLISKSIASIDILKNEWTENIELGWEFFISNIFNDLLITGNCFLEKINNKSSLKKLNILQIDPIICQNELVGLYVTEKNKKRLLNKDNFVHIKLHENSNMLYGISPIEPAQIAIEQFNLLQQYVSAIIQNGGRPSGILSFSEFLNSNQRENTINEMRNLYKNIGNKGTVAVIEGNYKWEQIGISPSELQIIPLLDKSSINICIAFDLSPILLGISDPTYSNYLEAKKQFISYNIIPTLKSVINQINFVFFKKKCLEIKTSNEVL